MLRLDVQDIVQDTPACELSVCAQLAPGQVYSLRQAVLE
jgi:hypothetical protein